jgi:hypothetical protein
VGVDTVFLQDFRHGVVEGFQRTPFAVQEIIASCMKLAPGRDTGHGTNIAVVKLKAMLSQTGKIGGNSCGFRVIAGEVSAI